MGGYRVLAFVITFVFIITMLILRIVPSIQRLLPTALKNLSVPAFTGARAMSDVSDFSLIIYSFSHTHEMGCSSFSPLSAGRWMTFRKRPAGHIPAMHKKG